MTDLHVERFAIPDVLRITPPRRQDARGYFAETYNERAYAEAGVDARFVQDNESFSVATHTLRGLHRQRPPHEQAKLVRVLKGSILDVAVDARPGSPTFGRWVKTVLSAENGAQSFIPRGFFHGFLTLEPGTHIAYKVDGFYCKEAEWSVRWNDPDLAIDWALAGATPLLSDKDRSAESWASIL